MKIKVLPEDFYVEESTDIHYTKTGAYSIYQLEKKQWDTFDLLDYLSRKYNLKNIGRAGIKDRYSHSVQFVSVKNGPKENIDEKNFSLSYKGKSDLPVIINSHTKNFFKIVIRDLNQKETEYIRTNLENVQSFGFCNYYDEQRMGSARAGQGFIAEKLTREHYNGALKLYLGTSSKYDDSRTRKLKKYILENWGDWQKCLQMPYELGPFQYPLVYLSKHPKDFKGAVMTIRRDLLEMFINAYQAYVWNETLKELLVSKQVDLVKSRYGFGELYFYKKLTDMQNKYFKDLVISAPSYKSKFADDEIKQAMEKVLARDILLIKDLKVYLNIKGLFFKPYDRIAMVMTEKLSWDNPVMDEQYLKKIKLTLSFFLPKGSYATVMLKRITSL